MYLVTVEIEVDPGRADEFRDLAKRHAENSLGEAGCLRFEVTVSEEDPAKFFIYEAYEDRDSVEIHRKQPYLASRPMVKSREISTWNSVSQ